MFTLKRVLMTSFATSGVLLYSGSLICLSLELPWRGNAHDESCIPAGFYDCRKRFDDRHHDHFELLDVPGRSGILMHRGNRLSDTRGCILLGTRADLSGDYLLGDAATAMYRMARYAPESFTLEIMEV